MLLKLDKQTHSHLPRNVPCHLPACSHREQGLCTAHHPSNMEPHPLQAQCLIRCEKWPVDGATTLFA